MLSSCWGYRVNSNDQPLFWHQRFATISGSKGRDHFQRFSKMGRRKSITTIITIHPFHLFSLKIHNTTCLLWNPHSVILELNLNKVMEEKICDTYDKHFGCQKWAFTILSFRIYGLNLSERDYPISSMTVQNIEKCAKKKTKFVSKTKKNFEFLEKNEKISISVQSPHKIIPHNYNYEKWKRLFEELNILVRTNK